LPQAIDGSLQAVNNNFMLDKRDAFTMIELVMVIAIISILSVVAVILIVPNKLSGVANKLMFDLRYTQQLAISRQKTYGISFNPSDNSYFVYIGDASRKADNPHNPHTKQEFFIDYDIDREYRGANLVDTNFGDLVSFGYLGTPYNSVGAALVNQGIVNLQYGSDTQAITIEPATGEVKIQ